MSRKLLIALLLPLLLSVSLCAQSPTEPPKQTARQALIEMFLGKGSDDFVKHLPEETRRTLIHKGDTPETSWALRFAMIGRQADLPNSHVETFDVGPTLLVMKENERERIEVLVEHDSFSGDSDEIELSVQYYENGKLFALPVIPQFTFTLAQEKEIWRLTEITAAAHVPLTDPDYLKGLRTRQNEQYEQMARMRMMMIAGAESRYAAKHPERGFSCTIQDLGFDGEEALSMGADETNLPGSEVSNGYRFTLSGCEAAPAKKYRVTAAPTDEEAETKTFCADESGNVKFILDGKPASCFTNGQPLNQESPPPPID